MKKDRPDTPLQSPTFGLFVIYALGLAIMLLQIRSLF